jgi:hypothetical protein
MCGVEKEERGYGFGILNKICSYENPETGSSQKLAFQELFRKRVTIAIEYQKIGFYVVLHRPLCNSRDFDLALLS